MLFDGPRGDRSRKGHGRADAAQVSEPVILHEFGAIISGPVRTAHFGGLCGPQTTGRRSVKAAWLACLRQREPPPAMVEQLNQAVQKALTMPIVVERLKKLGVETTTTSPDKFQQLLRDDWVQSGELIKASGATLN